MRKFFFALFFIILVAGLGGIVSNPVRLKRGLQSSLPVSAPVGEPLFCTDTGALFMGTGPGLVQIGLDPIKVIVGNSGAAGPKETWQSLSVNATANSTITYVPVMTTTGVGVGTWRFEYYIVCQSSATTTGVKFKVRQTGGLSLFIVHEFFINDSAAASTGTMARDAWVTAAGVTGTNYAIAAQATELGVPTGVTAANIELFVVIRGLFIVTTPGNWELLHGSETATSTQVLKGTNLVLRKMS